MSVIYVQEKQSSSDNVIPDSYTGHTMQKVRVSPQEMVEMTGQKPNHEYRRKMVNMAFKRQRVRNIQLFSNKWATRAFMTSCMILLVLVCTYVPPSIVFVIENIRGVYSFQWRQMLFSLPYLCSFLNPIIYFWRIPEYRQTLTRKCNKV